MATKTMKAVVRDRYGPPEVLRIEQVERPVPKDDEVLVRVRATSVTRTDLHMCYAKPFLWRFMLGLRRPKAKVLGLEFAGEVEAIGSAVTRFQVGDRVFGLRNGAPCGVRLRGGGPGGGAHARATWRSRRRLRSATASTRGWAT